MLLKILSPRQIPNKRTSWNRYVRMYYWLIKQLQNSYCRGAISDTINIGDVQIIHNVRDYWYEQELQRFHIDTAQHMVHQNAPYNVKRRCRRSSFFTWSESLLIFYNGKSYNIKRSDVYSIESELDGLLKISTDKDIILRSEFATKAGRGYDNKFPSGSSSVSIGFAQNNRPQSSRKKKIAVKDVMPTMSVIVTAVPKTPVVTATKTTQYRGFEENDLF